MRFYRWSAALVGLLLLLAATVVQAEGVAWRLDAAPGSVALRSFRTSMDVFRGEEKPATHDGLDTLFISGSGQYSEAGMETLSARLHALTRLPVYIVDLRQESHGFVDGAAVSLYGHRNQANAGISAPAVEADEAAALQALVGTDLAAEPMGHADKASMESFETTVQKVLTERAKAQQLGFHYVRIAATDQVWPEPQAVDAFIAFYRTLPKTPVWLHFHCQAGHGRTTTFMALYDMLRNPGIDADTAAYRQYLLGGADILQMPEDDDMSWRAQAARERITKLRLFHDYAQEQQPQEFAKSWSTWLAEHGEE